MTVHRRFRLSVIYCVLCSVCLAKSYSGNSNLGPSEQSEAYFNGSSYIRLQTTLSLKKQTGLSFRTCSGGSLFSQQQNDDVLELSVNAEGIIFYAKTGGKQYENKIIGNFLNNKWHTVYLQYRLGNLTIDVDGKTALIANSTYRNELLINSGLYNEGAGVLLVGKQFNGCLLEGPSLVFDPTIISSSPNVVFEKCPIPEDSCIPKEITKGYDYCMTEPCMRHGTCINGQSSYTCTCLPRYTGKNCEFDIGNPCNKTLPVCKNGATCTSDPSGEFTCNCLPGYNGRFCEHEARAQQLCKTTNPCQNGATCIDNGKIECLCPPGFGGMHCDMNVDDCKAMPCKNGGICTDGLNNYTCDCSLTGYTGYHCELNVNECLTNPCLNHGTCFDTYGGYLCQCLAGYGGKNCQNNINECISQPCLNHGICVDRLGGFECRCLPGFAGMLCEIEERQSQCDPSLCSPYADCVDINGGGIGCICKPEYPGTYPNCTNDLICLNNPCKNGGLCTAWKNTFNCSCPPGFTGHDCDQNNNCFHSNYCYNGGVCLIETSYSYCLCNRGWKGFRCNKRITCADNPCLNALYCQDYLGGYYCTCRRGWAGADCNIRLGYCFNNMCQNGGICIEQSDTYFCHCAPGFSGKFCQRTVEGCTSMPCLNGGICIEQPNGFYCNCTDQWMGKTCEKPYDVCELKPCLNNGSCITAPNKHDFACSCLPGFEGDTCEINIDDCIGVRCPTGKICNDLVNAYECRCPPGYRGENCTIDADPCQREPCGHGATCRLDEKTHEINCVCPSGYTGRRCQTDIDECAIVGICNKGICVNNNGSFECFCIPGYTGERCNVDFDECLSIPCKHSGTCLNKINNYECICPPGYAGKDCSIDINECDPMPCMAGSTCIDGINEFTCECQPGLTGIICDINIDDCESSPCLNGAQCIDGLNSYTCNCSNTGYTGIHCEINIDDCIGNPCKNGAKCIDDVMNYHCQCHPGYFGKNCENDFNECESDPCKYSGTCLQKSNMTLYYQNVVAELNVTLPESFEKPFDFAYAAGYECLCIEGVTGQNCEININECESSPCFQGTCVDKIGGYVCECEDGFEGEHCDIDIDECEKYRPCAYGKCIDKRANYYCDCDPKYGGKNCSVELIGCVDNPCLNKGSCKPYLINENKHRFNCTCPSGFHGQICEKVSTMSLSRNSIVTINTSREEGYDIQFRFKTTLGDGLLALGKGLTYYILELSRGRLNLHSSLLNKWEGVFIGSNLNDSNWQRVFVAINATHLVLSANDEQTIYPITFNENYNTTFTSFPYTYIGGIPSNLRKLTHGQPFLVGCMEDVLINGEWVLPENRNASWITFENVDVGCLREPQCTPNPCHSGGHCTDMWRDFKCTCERPYLGHTCQYNYTAATFGYENITDSLVTVTGADFARRAVRTIVDISMFIRTRQSRGQIFYLGSPFGATNSIDETYITAQLESGELLVRIQFNGNLESYTVGGVKLDNGFNHLIEVIRNVTLVQVKLNGTEYFRKTISATGPLDAQVLFLGGQPQSRSVRQTSEIAPKLDIVPPSPPTAPATINIPLSNVNFKGIIQDVQISNGSFTMVVEFFPLNADDLEIPVSFGAVTFDKITVLEGVRSDNSCRINPCKHNSACENTWNDYRCVCTHGFKGKDCNELEFCDLENCPNGSECKNLEDDYECLANATFDGKSAPLQYSFNVNQNMTKLQVFDTFEFKYRTKSWGTLLFAKLKDDYFSIFIYHNQVIIKWRFNKFVDSRRFRKDHFDGQWLTLYFVYKDSILIGGFKEMVIDDSANFEVGDFDISALTDIFLHGTIYLGGSDNNTFDYRSILEDNENITSYLTGDTTTTATLMGNSIEPAELYNEDTFLYKIDQNKRTDLFKGCLGEVRIGGLLLPFFTTMEVYPNNHSSEKYFELLPDTLATIGCRLCYNDDCYNRGFCINPSETYKCNCTDGYTADDCSIDINECENNQCQNNASCIDMIAKYKCECLPGYEGDNCEIDIDECLSNPCYNNGTCIDLIGSFKCLCGGDYVGEQCEAKRLITCDNKPCRNGASCKTGANEITGNNFTCYCTEGMEGALCDTPFCKREHCQKGQCNTTGEIPFCQCQKGFEGKFCEINIDDCVSPSGGSPCLNGGVCIDEISSFSCNCNGTGYTGRLCEMDIDECNLIKSPCGDKGACENIPGSYKCDCDIEGKCGHFCALDDPCLDINPCVNGECISQCAEKPDYFCNCHDNFTGPNCTENKLAISEGDDGLNILFIVVPVILVVLIALAVGLAILVNVARSKRATRGTYSPSAQEFCNPRVELDHVLKPPPEERLI